MSDEAGVNVHSVAGYSAAPPAVPDAFVHGTAETLVKWIGSFWHEAYGDPQFVRHLQAARAMRLAQLHLDLAEAAALVSRESAPVFHRERWRPCRVLRSRRNRVSGDFVRIGDGASMDEQGDASAYPGGSVFKVGIPDADIDGLVAYEIEGGPLESARCVVDSVCDPKAVLHRGVDFDIVRGTVVLAARYDPFSDGSPFPVFDTGDGDAESVLWFCDAEVDKDFVHGHIGYAIGLETPSSEAMKRVVSAAWNAVTEGATPRAFSALLSAVCGIPVALHDGEVVESVDFLDDATYVVTDRESYRLSRYADVNPAVRPGAVLGRFDPLDWSVRVYPFVTDVDRARFRTDLPEFADKFMKDVPAVDIPPAIVSSGGDGGFSVGWDEREVVFGGRDSNGNPMLWFRVDGSDEDNAEFWRYAWDSYEKSGSSMAGCFEGVSVPESAEEGDVVGTIVPIKFFLRNLVGANTVFVTVRTDALPDDSPLSDPEFFKTVRDCIPAHVRVFFIEHESVGGHDGPDEYDFGGADEPDDRWAELYAMDGVSEVVRMSSRRGFRSEDRVESSRFVPRCSIKGGM